MKPWNPFGAALALPLLLAACSKPVPPATPEAIAPAVRDASMALGKSVAGTLGKTLKGELEKAMQAGGPEAAIAVCSGKAMALTRSSIPADSAVIDISRVSSKPRNPENGPKNTDLLALAALEVKPEPMLINKSGTGDASDHIYFYQPLVIQPVCLKCHGDPEQFAPGVKAILKSNYPKDQATGYAEGDLRGAIRVTIDPAKLTAKETP